MSSKTPCLIALLATPLLALSAARGQEGVDYITVPRPVATMPTYWVDCDAFTDGDQRAVRHVGPFAVDVWLLGAPPAAPINIACVLLHYDARYVTFLSAEPGAGFQGASAGVADPNGAVYIEAYYEGGYPTYCCPGPSGPGDIHVARVYFAELGTYGTFGQTGMDIGPGGGTLPPTIVYPCNVYGYCAGGGEYVPDLSDAHGLVVVDPTMEHSCLNVNVTTNAPAASPDSSDPSIPQPLGRGDVSLRSALQVANLAPTYNLVTFRIATTGPPWTIMTGPALPTLTDPAGVTIDGLTQTGDAGVVVLRGPGGINGLTMTGPDNTVRGLTIGNYTSGAGVVISGAAATGNEILACNIGTNYAATATLPNSVGVRIDGASGNRVGSYSVADRNVISGNTTDGVLITGGATGNTIQGNYIGLNRLGVSDIPNGDDGVQIDESSGNTVGGLPDGPVSPGNPPGNYIAGNGDDGVVITGAAASGNLVQGNVIGLSVEPATLGNTGDGVEINNAPANTVGGGATARNVISDNGDSGVYITGAAATSNVVSGNLIGLDAGGNTAFGNFNDGVRIDGGAHDNTIGTTSAANRNVISANVHGIHIAGAGTTGNNIRGNFIGTNPIGMAAIGNTEAGVVIESASTNVIGGNVGAGCAQGYAPGNLISGNTQYGILITGSGATSNDIRGNAIGTNLASTAALPNGSGVRLDGVTNHVIGGTAAGDGNVISGNSPGSGVEIVGPGASNNRVEGNYLGLDFCGINPIGNATSGVWIGGAPNNVIGGTAAGAANTISANGFWGVQIDGAAATQNRVEGNFIGTDNSGTADRGNVLDGVRISDAPANMVGGAAAGARNIIAGNDASGVWISGQSATQNVVAGNYIGVDATGAMALPNSAHGVRISDAGSNTVGSLGALGRNIISGNSMHGVAVMDSTSSGNQVQNNYIGTDAAGVTGVPNGMDGVHIENARNTLVGGPLPEYRNVISANTDNGVQIADPNGTGDPLNSVVQNNYIGVNAAGTGPLGNIDDGVRLAGGANGNLVGGVTAGGPAGNVLSGNGAFGVRVGEGPPPPPFVGGGSWNTVTANIVGLNPAQTATIPNGTVPGTAGGGVAIWDVSTYNVIGGTNSGEANVIAGNSQYGVLVGGWSDNNGVYGNYIGVNQSGVAHPNLGDGVTITAASNNVISTNFIEGNTGYGVRIRAGQLTDDNDVLGNSIGTYANPNGLGGVRIERGAADNGVSGNTIRGNFGYGVEIADGWSDGNLVGANLIERNVGGVLIVGDQNGAPNGNYVGWTNAENFISDNLGDGVTIIAAAMNQVTENTISRNDGNGIRVSGAPNALRRNLIFDNDLLGIDLVPGDGVTLNDPNDPDSGGNGLQNFPVLTSAGGTIVMGTLNSSAGTAFTLEFFVSPACDPSGYGEGQTYVGAGDVMTDPNGNVSFTITLSQPLTDGTYVTATATDPAGNTSEFSECLEVGGCTSGPTIQTQPQSQAVCEGRAVSFTVVAAGAPPLSYQWQKGGFDLSDGGGISGSTTATLTVDPVEPTDAGEYSVVVTDACDAAVSDTAALVVDEVQSADIRMITNGGGGDGRLDISVDAYGSFQILSDVLGNEDLFDPAGAAGAARPTYSFGAFVFTDQAQRELLSDACLWQRTDLLNPPIGDPNNHFATDDSLERQITQCCVTSDRNNDGLDDTVESEFLVWGAGLSLTCSVTQSVGAVQSDGATYLRQDYTISSPASAAAFRIVFGLDCDLPWAGNPIYTDDWVGVGGSAENGWYVFQQEPDDTRLAVTLSSTPQAEAYYAGKHGVDPDGPGGDPAFGFGTGTLIWNNYGVPNAWQNYGAGIGYNAAGVSGSSPPGSVPPADAFVGLQFELTLAPGESRTITLVHTYGAITPRLHLGDMDCDGDVDFDDINAFVLAFSGPAAYYAAYPDCNYLNADINGDGDVNFEDINAFVALLAG